MVNYRSLSSVSDHRAESDKAVFQHIRHPGFTFAAGVACLTTALSLALPSPLIGHAHAASTVSLSLRAILPAETYADGPASGSALASKKKINGIAVPFTSQAAGSFTGITRGQYNNTWLLLAGGGFDGKANSADLLLRAMLIDIDWRKTDGTGSGAVNLGDWIGLSDPHKLISAAIRNSTDPTRPLTNGDYTLRGIGRATDQSLWTVDSAANMLHFNADGSLSEAPHSLTGIADGAVQDIGLFPDGQSLLVAFQSAGKIEAQVYTTAGAVKGNPLGYTLDAASDQTRGWLPINDHQALVIEQDDKQNAEAKIKRIYLIDLNNAPNGTLTKTLLADLLKIDDPHGLGTDKVFGSSANQFGLAPFSFPYQTIGGVYPLDSKTLIVFNDNHFPFGTGRDASKAAPTEMIGLTLPAALDVRLNVVQQ